MVTAAAPFNDTQDRVFAFIKAHITEKGYAPGIRDIMPACAIKSTSTVMWHLERLEARGLIVRGPAGHNRAIRLAAPAGCCPTCGQRAPE